MVDWSVAVARSRLSPTDAIDRIPSGGLEDEET
jgi:hypothetical protein